MIRYIFEHFVDINDKKNINTYIYGCELLIFNLIPLVTLLLTGIAFNCLYFNILFAFYFCPLRIFLGGYHCKRGINCILFFLFIIIILSILYYYFIPNKLIIIITSFCLLFINYQTPYSNDNSLNYYQNILIAKKYVHILSTVYILTVFIFHHNNVITSAYVYACSVNIFLFLLGKAQHAIKLY